MKNSGTGTNTQSLIQAIRSEGLVSQLGKVCGIHGLVIEASGCKVQLGELVNVIQSRTGQSSLAEVVGLRGDKVLLMPYGATDGLCLDSKIVPLKKPFGFPVSSKLLGTVVDPLGNILDNASAFESSREVRTKSEPINPMVREPIDKKLNTGVKAIDIFTPLGKGQRIGIFAGSGVGKSTLLGMISRYTSADVIVIALVGERGREVGEFVTDILGVDGRKRAVLVAATAGDTAVMRRQAAYSATALAEWYRESGKDVLLILDSITRFAMAQREIGIAIGEPVGSRGYPPSVFALMPPLLERPGSIKGEGSITAVYTVLVEGDDFNEPISDHVRSILDGHIVLSRELAEQGLYPSIDILSSVSRLQGKLMTAEQQKAVAALRSVYGNYVKSADLIDLGLYKKGNSRKTDLAISMNDTIRRLLSQTPEEFPDPEGVWKQVMAIAEKADHGNQ